MRTGANRCWIGEANVRQTLDSLNSLIALRQGDHLGVAGDLKERGPVFNRVVATRIMGCVAHKGQRAAPVTNEGTRLLFYRGCVSGKGG